MRNAITSINVGNVCVDVIIMYMIEKQILI